MAIDAIYGERLAILCGAGLSMAPPSRLPSAAHLAAEAKTTYDGRYGASRAPLAADIEAQAQFFFERDELATVYLRTLIDPNTFAGRPNKGHFAVADLLLARALQLAVSTNVDVMIENAGQYLFGSVRVALDGNGIAAMPASVAPMLKVHGCWQTDLDHTVWAPGQLLAEPVASRISSSAQCLATRLLDRDLLLVGYFTDWDYLNKVLEETLGTIHPSRVIVVNPDASASLAGKAAHLHALGSRAGSGTKFFHVRESADSFLDALRAEFSRGFLRTMISSGKSAYESQIGLSFDDSWAELHNVESDDLWQLRRDLQGCSPRQPASLREPMHEPVLGFALTQMRAAGATTVGALWELGGQKIRFLRALGQFLHETEDAHSSDIPPVSAPDIVIAFGAYPSSLPPNIVRSSSSSSVARGTQSRWMTWDDASTELLT